MKAVLGQLQCALWASLLPELCLSTGSMDKHGAGEVESRFFIVHTSCMMMP